MEKINITDFENIVEALRKNVEYYERALEPTRYFMALANGDRVNLSIPKKTIGHLLGIKIVDHIIITNSGYYSFLANAQI